MVEYSFQLGLKQMIFTLDIVFTHTSKIFDLWNLHEVAGNRKIIYKQFLCT